MNHNDNNTKIQNNAFTALQTMLIVWKLIEFEPFSEWSWMMIFSPTLVSIILFVLTLILVMLIKIIFAIKNKKNKK